MVKKVKAQSSKLKAGIKDSNKVPSTLAKSADGTVQITFTIPFVTIDKARSTQAKELAKEVTVAGFRKGKAPPETATAQIPQNILIEKTLQQILPRLLAEAITTHKIRPATYPKFELVKAQDGEDWQIRAITCELPKIDLKDYKKTIVGASRAKSIWTPDKGAPTDEKKGKIEPSKEEKEQEVIKILLETIKIEVPKLLIEEEVSGRLSRLLERLERLGLALENYLASMGKTPEILRQEYEKQASDTIALTLILNAIAEKEKIKADTKQIDEIITSSAKNAKTKEQVDTPEQRRLIESMLIRRSVLDSLASLL